MSAPERWANTMKFINSTAALRTANNVLFGLSMITLVLMMVAGTSEPKSRASEGVQNATFYTWFGFLTLWAVSMLIGFVFDLLKKEGRLLLNALRVSCAAGAVHIALVPLMFVVR
jgi:hypothetical protein